ncbi:hypothetical protein J3E68DRAFT_405614 [Trichoderma sp. SZMC 28012]
MRLNESAPQTMRWIYKRILTAGCFLCAAQALLLALHRSGEIRSTEEERVCVFHAHYYNETLFCERRRKKNKGSHVEIGDVAPGFTTGEVLSRVRPRKGGKAGHLALVCCGPELEGQMIKLIIIVHSGCPSLDRSSR